MKSTEVLSKLRRVNFTNEQAETIMDVLEDRQNDLAIKSDVEAVEAKVSWKQK